MNNGFDLVMTAKTTSVWFVYFLECLNGKIYSGITTNVLEYQIKQMSPAKKRALGLIWNEINKRV